MGYEKCKQFTDKRKENIILSELRERPFDNLVSFKFKEQSIHECSEKFDNLSIDIKSIEKQPRDT